MRLLASISSFRLLFCSWSLLMVFLYAFAWTSFFFLLSCCCCCSVFFMSLCVFVFFCFFCFVCLRSFLSFFCLLFCSWSFLMLFLYAFVWTSYSSLSPSSC